MNIVSTLIEAHIFKHTERGIEFLLIKRAPDDVLYPNLWQMVTGSINENESAHKTALREIFEETGLTPTRMWVVPNLNSFYDHKKNRINMIPVFAAMADANSVVKLSEEHCEYLWTDFQNAKKMLAWQGQRNSVDIIQHYFLNEKSNFDLLEIQLG